MTTRYVLYTTGCPRCEVLKKKLEQKHIQFESVTNIDYMIAEGMTEAPVLGVLTDDSTELRLNFVEAVTYINGLED